MADTEKITPESITKELDGLKDAYFAALDELMNKCLTYNSEYFLYVRENLKDATLLKRSMKEMLIRAVKTNEL